MLKESFYLIWWRDASLFFFQWATCLNMNNNNNNNNNNNKKLTIPCVKKSF